MKEELLAILEKNSRIDFKELAVLLGISEEKVLEEITELEKAGVICGYHTLINWEKTSIEKVNALIEVKVTPQRGQGFDRIAERIYNYPEVRAVYLISGGYDLLVTLEEKTLKEIKLRITINVYQSVIAKVEYPTHNNKKTLYSSTRSIALKLLGSRLACLENRIGFNIQIPFLAVFRFAEFYRNSCVGQRFLHSFIPLYRLSISFLGA